MFRPCAAFLLLLLGAAAAGLPAARGQDGQTLRGWGQVVDPKRDCKVEEQDGVLSITVPAAYRDLHLNLDAARVLQDVDGDFTVQVRARRFRRPAPKSGVNPANPVSYVSSGLLVWQDGNKYVRFQRAANGDSKFVGTLGGYFSGGKIVAFSRVVLADEDIYLRVTRRDGRLSLAQSGDGRTWTAVQTKGEEFALPGRVKVGVFVINATNREITHELTEFKLTSP